MAIAITKVKNQLLSKIEKDDAVEVEKVERYISLIQTLRDLQKIVKQEGATTTTINASQEFVKAHPALGEISKINSQLIALEKSIKYVEVVPDEKDKRVQLT